MKLKYFFAVFLIGSFLFFRNVFALSGDIVINEIGAYPSSTHEWIEIFNKGDQPIDISGWKFWENGTNHSLKAATSSDSIIEPGEYAVICQDADVFFADHPNFSGSIIDSSWSSLSESGEEIGLKDSDGNFVEKFTYVSAAKFSLERVDPFLEDYTDNNWRLHPTGNSVGEKNFNFNLGTGGDEDSGNDTENGDEENQEENNDADDLSGEPNTFVTSSLFIFLKINEVISYPESGNEMVEIYNTTSTAIDLSGLKICDSTLSGCKNLSGVISGKDWLVLDLMTDRYLNNSGDSIVLKTDNNEVLDSVSYGTATLPASQKGQSLSRKEDGVDTDNDSDWANSTVITLGFGNQIVEPPEKTSSGSSAVGSASVSTVSSVSAAKKITTVIDPVKILWSVKYPYGLDVGEVGNFSAAGTADPRGGILEYWWDFGDTSTSTGSVVGHSFASSGEYVVVVSASSSSGTIGKKEFKVYVERDFSATDTQLKIFNFDITNTNTAEQFIEISNFATSSRNLSGWKIRNNDNKYYDFPENTRISASSSLKFFRSVTHLSFDKDGDNIFLTNPNDAVADNVQVNLKVATAAIKSSVQKTSIKSSGVSVSGLVTVLPGVLASQYFYIIDEKNVAWQVYQYQKDFPDLMVGDKIRVYGELGENNGVKRIKLKSKLSVQKIKSNNLLGIPDFIFSDFSEEMLGTIVKTSGEVTDIKSNYIYLDDGESEGVIFFKKSKVNKEELSIGDKVEVVGIIEKTKDGFRILPRDSSDLKVVVRKDIISSSTIEGVVLDKDASEKYVAVTAGGAGTLLLGIILRSRAAVLAVGARRVVAFAGKLIRRG